MVGVVIGVGVGDIGEFPERILIELQEFKNFKTSEEFSIVSFLVSDISSQSGSFHFKV